MGAEPTPAIFVTLAVARRLTLPLAMAFLLAGCGVAEKPSLTSPPPADSGGGSEAGQDASPAEDHVPIGSTPDELPQQVKLTAADSYTTSTACQACHKEHYASWHATYHRTMTQEASPESVLGNFDGEVFGIQGYPVRPFRQGDKFYMQLVHPGWEDQELKAGRDPIANPQPPAILYAVDRVIGSHHQQVYLSRGPDGSYHTLPLVWHIHLQRWITRRGSFLAEPMGGFYHKTKMWNNGCVFCHNTGPSPGLQQLSAADGSPQFAWNTQVEELGIACEACHGPGGRHVELQQSLTTAPSDAKKPQDQLIVNPLKLSQEESLLTCARCHGKMIAKDEFDRQCLVEGDFFQPGEWDYVDRYDQPSHEPGTAFDETQEGRYFWSDGTPRTTALEYQGVQLSACYQQGDMTCLSCHSMHNAAPDDQLIYGDRRDGENATQNRACTQCHTQFEDSTQLAAHTHHDGLSSGSLCVNCHMPYQAYSLLKRVRSHRISNPSATATAESGIPNACNSCHVDQTLEWTHTQLSQWPTQPASELKPRYPGVAATVADALAGHALQRALAIEQLGAEETFEVAPGAWRAPVLIEALEDNYEAARLLAYQALRKQPGFEDFQFDYLGTDAERAVQVAEARQRWQQQSSDSSQRGRLAQLLGGQADDDPQPLLKQLLEQRNDVSIDVLE